MSDAAFATARYVGYTTAELKEFTAVPWLVSALTLDEYKAMEAEIVRRAKVSIGDVTAMTPGERLRYGVKNDGL